MFERSVVQSSRPSQMSTDWEVPGQPATHNQPNHTDIPTMWIVNFSCIAIMWFNFMQMNVPQFTYYILKIPFQKPIMLDSIVNFPAPINQTKFQWKWPSHSLWLTATIVVAGTWGNDDWVCQNRTHTAWIGVLWADRRPLELAVRKDIKTTWAASDLCGTPGHAHGHMPHTDPPTDEPTGKKGHQKNTGQKQQQPSNIVTNRIFLNRTAVSSQQ